MITFCVLRECCELSWRSARNSAVWRCNNNQSLLLFWFTVISDMITSQRCSVRPVSRVTYSPLNERLEQWKKGWQHVNAFTVWRDCQHSYLTFNIRILSFCYNHLYTRYISLHTSHIRTLSSPHITYTDPYITYTSPIRTLHFLIHHIYARCKSPIRRAYTWFTACVYVIYSVCICDSRIIINIWMLNTNADSHVTQ